MAKKRFEHIRAEKAKKRAEEDRLYKTSFADLMEHVARDELKYLKEEMKKPSILMEEMFRVVEDPSAPPGTVYLTPDGSDFIKITVADSSYLPPGTIVDLTVPATTPYWTPAPKTTLTFSGSSVRYYTGIGSRETPIEVQAFMRFLAITLAKEGWTLRSGGAEGADSAFEEGCDDAGGKKEIFLPWEGFNGRKEDYETVYANQGEPAFEIAKEHHPAWDRLTDGGKKLHARNVHQVVGSASAPGCHVYSEFVVCWTKNGKGQGGTGQAIRIANAYGVPVFDLGEDPWISSTSLIPKSVAELSTYLDRDLMLEFEEWRNG